MLTIEDIGNYSGGANALLTRVGKLLNNDNHLSMKEFRRAFPSFLTLVQCDIKVKDFYISTATDQEKTAYLGYFGYTKKSGVLSAFPLYTKVKIISDKKTEIRRCVRYAKRKIFLNSHKGSIIGGVSTGVIVGIILSLPAIIQFLTPIVIQIFESIIKLFS